jgi:hypothetical protein
MNMNAIQARTVLRLVLKRIGGYAREFMCITPEKVLSTEALF